MRTPVGCHLLEDTTGTGSISATVHVAGFFVGYVLCFFVVRRQNVVRRQKKAHSPTSEDVFSLSEDKTLSEDKRKHTHQLQNMFGLTQKDSTVVKIVQ